MGKNLLRLVLALGALAAVGDTNGGASARAAAPAGGRPAFVLAGEGMRVAAPAWGRARRFGPYATLRRANEVANYYRARGYNARVLYLGSLYLGTRSYAVNVW